MVSAAALWWCCAVLPTMDCAAAPAARCVQNCIANQNSRWVDLPDEEVTDDDMVHITEDDFLDTGCQTVPQQSGRYVPGLPVNGSPAAYWARRDGAPAADFRTAAPNSLHKMPPGPHLPPAFNPYFYPAFPPQQPPQQQSPPHQRQHDPAGPDSPGSDPSLGLGLGFTPKENSIDNA